MREIRLMISGDTVHSNQYRAGVKGSVNAAELVAQFDESWDNYSKKIVFWDALEQHPVERSLLVEETPRTYRTTIPGEPLALAGECVLVIEGWTDTVRMRAMQVRLKVDDAPDADSAAIPLDPTLTQMEQMQIYVEGKLLDVQTVAGAAEDSARRAQDAAYEADGSMQTARGYGEMAALHCKGAAQYAEEAEQHKLIAEGYREEAHLASTAAGQSEMAAAGHAKTAEEQAELAYVHREMAESAMADAGRSRLDADNRAFDAERSAGLAEQHAKQAKEAAEYYPHIENGTWWVWSPLDGCFIDTGVEARGAAVYHSDQEPTFSYDGGWSDPVTGVNNGGYDLPESAIDSELHPVQERDLILAGGYCWQVDWVDGGYVYLKRLFSMVGPQGQQGPQGEKGEKGEKGVSGVYVGSGEMPEDCNVQVDPNGDTLTEKELVDAVLAAMPVAEGVRY